MGDGRDSEADGKETQERFDAARSKDLRQRPPGRRGSKKGASSDQRIRPASPNRSIAVPVTTMLRVSAVEGMIWCGTPITAISAR